MAHRRIVSISARAFVSPCKGNDKIGTTWEEIARSHGNEGGNPVTIFYSIGNSSKSESEVALSPHERSALAKSCSWESVIIEPQNGSDVHTFRFFMPSGEEVSFCGHAAIGASAFVANRASLLHSKEPLTEKVKSSQTTVSFNTADNSRYYSSVCSNKVELMMNVSHEEIDIEKMPNAPTLEEILRDLGLDSNDAMAEQNDWPKYINSSVARAKTLIPIKSSELLHGATPPKDPNKFRDMCDSIDSSGIYLYSKCDKGEDVLNNSFECRQFPRASGYAEDPATGIAAGALAASLYKRTIGRACYFISQGTAMGRPSNIQVNIENYNGSDVKLSYSGLVAFDSISCPD
jgi:PhzF family phenazine biosynthesis protein